MKRRNFLANTSLVMAGISVPLGLSALTAPSALLTADQAEMLKAFQLTLANYPGSASLKARLATVSSIEYADATTFRFRSRSGERLELQRVGDRVITRSLA